MKKPLRYMNMRWICTLCNRQFATYIKAKFHLNKHHRTGVTTPLYPVYSSSGENNGVAVKHENLNRRKAFFKTPEELHCHRCLETKHPCLCERAKMKK